MQGWWYVTRGLCALNNGRGLPRDTYRVYSGHVCITVMILFITSITMLFFSSDSMLYIYKRYLSFRERTACVSAFICVMPAWTRICMHICMQAYARMLAYTRVYVHIREYDLLYMLTYTFMVLHVQTRVSMRTPRERIYIYET